MLELLSYRFFVNALLASVLAGVSCGIVGTYIVSRRMVFVSGGIAHAAFGGIGLGFYLGLHPVPCAGVFALFSALAMVFLSRKFDIREDTVIGMLWSFGMAVGVIFVHLTPGYVPNLMTYLFGNILAVSDFDILCLLGLSAITIVFFWALFREILYISFDEEYARSQSMPVETINCLLICLVAATIVLHIRIVGIILVISLLTIPQATAGLLSRDFKRIAFYSVLYSVLASFSGLFAAHSLQMPSGASIIFSSVAFFALTGIAVQARKKFRIRKKLRTQ